MALETVIAVVADPSVPSVRYPQIENVGDANCAMYQEFLRYAPGALFGISCSNGVQQLILFYEGNNDLGVFINECRSEIIANLNLSVSLQGELMQVLCQNFESVSLCATPHVANNSYNVNIDCVTFTNEQWKQSFDIAPHYCVHLVRGDGSNSEIMHNLFQPRNGEGIIRSGVTAYIRDSGGLVYLVTTAHDITNVTQAMIAADGGDAPLSKLLFMAKSQIYCFDDIERAQFMVKYDSRKLYTRASDPSVLYKHSVAHVVADVAIFGFEDETLCGTAAFSPLIHVTRAAGTAKNKCTLPLWDQFEVEVHSARLADGSRIKVSVVGIVSACVDVGSMVHEILFYGSVPVGENGFLEVFGGHSGLGLYDAEGRLHSAIKEGTAVDANGVQTVFLTPAALILDQARCLLHDNSLSFVKI